LVQTAFSLSISQTDRAACCKRAFKPFPASRLHRKRAFKSFPASRLHRKRAFKPFPASRLYRKRAFKSFPASHLYRKRAFKPFPASRLYRKRAATAFYPYRLPNCFFSTLPSIVAQTTVSNFNTYAMVSLTKLPVATAESLAAEIIHDVEASGKQEITESPLFASLKNSKEKYTQSFNKVRASSHTVRLIAADENRNRRYIGVRTYTLAHTYSWLPDTKTAADQMMTVLDAHGTGIESMAHNEESGRIHKILADLNKTTYSDSVAKTGMGPWIMALATAQKEFESIDAERTTERASDKDIASATKQRRELQAALKTFIKYMEVMTEINTDATWRNLLAQIEQRVTEAEAGYRPTHREKKDNPS